jgi:hypothetical protein
MFLRHMPLNCPCIAKSSGDKWTHARAFPGTISAQKVYPEEVRAHASSRPVAEEGANAHPGRAAENARTRARAQCLRGDLQLEPMWMGSHKKINVQQGRPFDPSVRPWLFLGYGP